MMKAIMRDEHEMKNSGIEWLEFIPVQWNYSPIKRVVIDRSGGAWGEEPQNINDIICMRIADFDFERGFFADKDESLLTKRSYTNAQIQKLMLQYGDLLVEKSGGGENTPVGRAVLFNKEYDALFANFMDRLRFDMQTVYPLFVAYYWRAMYYKTVTTPYIKQTTGIQNLNIASLLEKEYIFYPSLKEQQLIANYLDDRCSKIDAIIAEAKASIEEYKELKQAVIYEAVTKGLDKNVDMKDSGMKSIGKIPSHWNIYKMNLLSNRIGDGLHGTPEYDDFGEVYFINGNNLGGENIEIKNSTKRINLNEAQKYQVNLGRNTLLISLNGTIGNVSKYNNENIILGKSAGYINLKKGVNRDFIRYYLQSPSTATLFDLERTGTTIFNLSLETLRNLKICIPPSVEQEEIVDHLNNKIKRLDTLVSEKQSLIEDLEAYKKSLIYKVVTGKRKVVA